MKKILLISIYLFLIITLIGCNNNISTEQVSDNVLSQTQLSFMPNDDLNYVLHLDEIIDNIRLNPYGSMGPRIAYVNDEYVIILNYNGILIFHKDSYKVIGGIDNMKLSMSYMQGDSYTRISGNNDYIFIYANNNQYSGYVYSLKTNKLQEIDNFNDKSFISGENINSISVDMTMSINEVYSDDDNAIDCFKYKNNIYVLQYGYNAFTPWNLYILDKKLEEMTVYNII